MPFQIGCHVHPKPVSTPHPRRPRTRVDPAPASTPTGIDYLRLVEDGHTRSLGERLHYAQLADPTPPTDPTQPSELPAASQAADAVAVQDPPRDRDGLAYSPDPLTLAEGPPAGDPADDRAPGSASPDPDAALHAELASFAALRRTDPTELASAPDSAAPDPEETR